MHFDIGCTSAINAKSYSGSLATEYTSTKKQYHHHFVHFLCTPFKSAQTKKGSLWCDTIEQNYY